MKLINMKGLEVCKDNSAIRCNGGQSDYKIVIRVVACNAGRQSLGDLIQLPRSFKSTARPGSIRAVNKNAADRGSRAKFPSPQCGLHANINKQVNDCEEIAEFQGLGSSFCVGKEVIFNGTLRRNSTSVSPVIAACLCAQVCERSISIKNTETHKFKSRALNYRYGALSRCLTSDVAGEIKPPDSWLAQLMIGVPEERMSFEQNSFTRLAYCATLRAHSGHTSFSFGFAQRRERSLACQAPSCTHIVLLTYESPLVKSLSSFSFSFEDGALYYPIPCGSASGMLNSRITGESGKLRNDVPARRVVVPF
ncbi:hypothetical protein KQX54_020136 [Cotesia glomerata]|uniref:Uncharacterized protein n=1 Tax=Cotesia glomerata TaxID=32391 RepID=A0AAV7IHF3_COTGL|nr:hypothetical protein KQX54_020136 [Cotesia glomerata]